MVKKKVKLVKKNNLLEKLSRKIESDRKKRGTQPSVVGVVEKPVVNPVVESQKKSRDELLKCYLSFDKVKNKSLGMGVHNGVFYYGTVIHKGSRPCSSVVTSDKKIYCCWPSSDPRRIPPDDEIKRDFGLNYRYEFFEESLDHSWENKSIHSWLFGKPLIPSLKELYDDIKKRNELYIYHHDKRVHSFVAVDILSSYFLVLFNAKGRTFFIAERQSGKTEQTKIYQLLVFNPFMYGDGTSSSYFRIVESTKGTPLIEDFDLINEEKKNDQTQLIRVGYKKDIKAIRSDGYSFRPNSYDLYSSCVINNIAGLDDITTDRCISIMMLRTDKKTLTNNRPNTNDHSWIYLRNQLYTAGLTYWKEVQQTYDELKTEELGGRDFEKVRPHLAIAKLISQEVYDELLKFFIDLSESSRVRDLETEWGYILICYLYEVCKDLKKQQKKDGYIPVKDIVNKTWIKALDISKEDRDYKKKIRGYSAFIGKYLSSYSTLFKGRMVNGCNEYLIKLESVVYLIKLKNYEKQIPDFDPKTIIINLLGDKGMFEEGLIKAVLEKRIDLKEEDVKELLKQMAKDSLIIKKDSLWSVIE